MSVTTVTLHKKQGLAFRSQATEILYGGAAGGGKSHLMRVAAISWCLEIAGLQVYLFRRNYPDLIANHIDGPSGFPALLGEMINLGAASFNLSRLEVGFANGSKIHLCHCQHEHDVIKYQGAEIHVLLIDELTHFMESMYRFLRGRVRLGGLVIPPHYKGQFPRIMSGSNPGNLGHAWVKRMFIDEIPQYEHVKMPSSEGGLVRQYIPALLSDNPTLTANDPEYEMRLEGLGSPDLVKAMRFGLWDITAGAALEKLSRDVHMVRPFVVPNHWTKFTVIDWGSAKPFAVGWFCVADDDTELKAKGQWNAKFIPKGALIMYREWYGWNGKPDEGCRMESPAVAKQILEIEEEAGEDIDYRVGDSAMWAATDGPSVQERMYTSTDGQYSMMQSKKDRISNYEEIRTRLVGDDYPMLYIAENCRHAWRTLPDLQLDQMHPEKGPDSSMEDHIYDVLAYACASRPYVTTKKERIDDEYKRARRKVFGQTKSFY